jgi:hypothetical protein
MSVSSGDIIRVTAVMDSQHGHIENVYYFRSDLPIPAADEDYMADLAVKLESVYGAILSNLSIDTIFTEVQGYNVTTDQPMPTIGWPTLTAGTGAAQSLPAGVSALAILRTGVKRVLGRKFFGLLQTGVLDGDGFLTAGVVTAVATAAGELIGGFLGSETLSGWLPGVRDKTGAFWAFIEAVASNNPGYQRRRRRGRGI